MLNKKIGKIKPSGKADFIEFLNQRKDFIYLLDDKPAIDKSADKPVAVPATIAPAANKNYVRSNRLPLALKMFLPDVYHGHRAEFDIEGHMISSWQKDLSNINQELAEMRRLHRINKYGKLVKATIKDPANVYPLMHNVKEKTSSVKRKTTQRLSQNPWGLELVATVLIALIASCSIGRLAPDTADKITSIADHLIVYPLEKAAVSFILPAEQPVNRSQLSSYIINNQNKIKTESEINNFINVSEYDIKGTVAGAYENIDGEEILNKVTSETPALDSFAAKIAGFYEAFFTSLAEKQENLSLDLNDKLIEAIK